MPLLYDGSTGMAYEVPISEIENFLRKGFRSTPPFVAESPIAPSEPIALLSVATALSNPSAINVNMASLKELAALPLVGTAIAKQMRDNRPYASVEDLIARIPEVDWLTINPQLSYANPDAAD